jgi:uncharacterized membrane protein
LPSLDVRKVLFFAYVATMLLIFIFYVPPFAKADEPAHFHRAVSLTNLDLTCSRDANGEYYWPMKRKYSDLPDELHYYEVTFEGARFNRDWLRADFSDPRFDEPGRVYRFCSLPPPGYIPNAAGILIGKPFENPLVSFYLGRIGGALFFVVALVWALQTCPERYRPLIYLYAGLPLVLHQVSAMSYDAVQLSLFPLIFAYMARFGAQEESIKPKQLLIFLALLLWVVNVRLGAYYPLLLLLFVIDRHKVGPNLPRYLAYAGGFVGLTAASALVFALLYLPRSDDSTPPDMGIDSGAQMTFVLEHPLDFISTGFRTIDERGDLLVREMIGILGWNVYQLNHAPYYAVIFTAAIVCYYVAQRDMPVLKWGQFLALAGALFCTVAALFGSLYLVWSPVGADVVSGLQGRYFVGLVPFAIFLVSQVAATIGRRRMLTVLLVALAVFLIVNLVKGIDYRYYG